MKRRIVAHPTGPGLLHTAGRGGPGIIPPGHANPAPKPRTPPLSNPLDAITQQLSGAVQSAVGKIIPAGEVFIGVALIVVGLLLATGLAGRGGRVALSAATRGLVK